MTDDKAIFEPQTDDPFEQFRLWFADAEASEVNDANAMTLATAGSDGRPSARIVLMKDYDESGVVFYTNTESQKGLQLAVNPFAALLFHWKSLRRQVRFEGAVTPATAPRPTPITTAVRATAGSAPGPRSSRARSPTARP